jgi:hypothetical protein
MTTCTHGEIRKIIDLRNYVVYMGAEMTYKSPYDRAQEVYDKEWCPRTFREDLELHFRNGVVFSTPICFIMARMVYSKAPSHEITDPRYTSWSNDPDCWHIYLVAGYPVECLNIEPFKLPLFSYERRGHLKIVAREHVLELLKRYEKKEYGI